MQIHYPDNEDHAECFFEEIGFQNGRLFWHFANLLIFQARKLNFCMVKPFGKCMSEIMLFLKWPTFLWHFAKSLIIQARKLKFCMVKAIVKCLLEIMLFSKWPTFFGTLPSLLLFKIES